MAGGGGDDAALLAFLRLEEPLDLVGYVEASVVVVVRGAWV